MISESYMREFVCFLFVIDCVGWFLVFGLGATRTNPTPKNLIWVPMSSAVANKGVGSQTRVVFFFKLSRALLFCRPDRPCLATETGDLLSDSASTLFTDDDGLW